jgi:hypothetical protein
MNSKSIEFKNLPTDLKFAIFYFFEPEDLARNTRVCKEWNDLLHQDHFFKYLTKKLFKPNIFEHNVRNWRIDYMNILFIDLPEINCKTDWIGIQKMIETRVTVSVLRVDYLYQKGMEIFPNCSPLMGNYAKYL